MNATEISRFSVKMFVTHNQTCAWAKNQDPRSTGHWIPHKIRILGSKIPLGPGSHAKSEFKDTRSPGFHTKTRILGSKIPWIPCKIRISGSKISWIPRKMGNFKIQDPLDPMQNQNTWILRETKFRIQDPLDPTQSQNLKIQDPLDPTQHQDFRKTKIPCILHKIKP